MTAHQALQEARRRGITLTSAGKTLRFRGPTDALSEAFKRELKRNKPEIIVLLGEGPSTYPCSRCERFAFAEADVVCYWCRSAARVPHHA